MVFVRGVLATTCVLVISLAACGGKHGGDDDDDGGTGAASLTISPASATVALTRTATGYTATQAFTVTATAADGSTRDVTGDVVWSVDDPASLAFAAGTATVHAAGPYLVTAFYADQIAHATLTATLADTGVAAGFPDGSQGKLDGAPTAAAPSIAYPLAGSLFPINLPAIEIHVHKSDPSQTLARVAISDGALLDYKLYAPCAASPNPGKFPDACIVTLDKTFAPQLAGVSEAADLQLTVRLAAGDGSQLAESAPIALAWSKVALSGGLYYWTTGAAGGDDTQVARYNFDTADQPPEVFLSNTLAPKVPQGGEQCIGCHALSPDGAKLSFSMGGSTGGYYALFDVATTTAIQTNLTQKFADMATFSPDGSRVVTMSYGQLTLRHADTTLGVIADNLFAADVGEKVSHPFWSPGGGHLAFVSWNPSAADQLAGHVTGDMVQGGQIWIANSDGQAITSAPRLLVPRADNLTSFYPSISDDDAFVVFNRSRCDGPANSGGWGAGPCDGYNDISATLNLVSTSGGAVVPLTRANGGADPDTTNSWPRWSPDHGTFRGKRLYWVAFSSRRAYGLALAGSQSDTTKPQLWFAAVALASDGSTPSSPDEDPSFAPVWLPGQNPVVATPRGNHTPVWTSKVVILQ
ncbi:MAG TPA: hypothetical protein VFP84_11390 [Kofleriaceae bacterium]|nr:hypothetical protein [Kofleriaceae bacterium]